MKMSIPRLVVNPIIVKEIRSRMRGPRPFITLTLTLLLTGGIMYLMLQIILAQSRFMNVLSPQIGQGLFAALAYLELFMVCAITPAVTSGAISSEREKQTYEMLVATPLSPASILWGKLVSALSYVFLLLLAAVPLASVVFIFGGVAPADMARVLLVLLVIAITFGILGLFMSSLFGRSGWATIASFITVLILTLAPLFIAAAVGIIQQREPPRWLLAPSPVSALAAALAPAMGNNNFNSVLSLFNVLGGMWSMGVSAISQTDIPRPLYHYSLPFYAGLSLVLYLLSTRLVQPSRRFHLRPKELLVGLGVLLIFIGLVTGAFLATSSRYEWAVNPNRFAPTTVPAMVQMPVMPGGGGVIIQPVMTVAVMQATPTPPTLTPTPAGKTEENLDINAQVEIYTAVIRDLYHHDQTFAAGKPPAWNIIYILSEANDGAGDPSQDFKPTPIDPQVLDGIRASFKDLPVEVRFAKTFNDVPKNKSINAVEDGKGIMITLGNIHLQKDGTVQVPGSIYYASLNASGRTYVLTKVDGKWKVTGTTGVEWIS